MRLREHFGCGKGCPDYGSDVGVPQPMAFVLFPFFQTAPYFNTDSCHVEIWGDGDADL